jgi:hypothetical protein
MVFFKHRRIALAMILETPGARPKVGIVGEKHPSFAPCRDYLVLTE